MTEPVKPTSPEDQVDEKESTPLSQLGSQNSESTPNVASPDDKKSPLETPKKSRFAAFFSKADTIEKTPEPVPTTSKFDVNSDGYVSAREAINALDKEMHEDALTDEERVAREVHEQLEEQAEYLVIRVRKSKLLLWVGVSVLLLWTIVMVYFVRSKNPSFFNTVWFTSATPSPSPEPTAQPTPVITPVPESFKVRVKTPRQTDTVAAVVDRLNDRNGFVVDVEFVSVNEKVTLISTKKNAVTLIPEIVALLQPDYDATSSTTPLADDSVFDAVISINK